MLNLKECVDILTNTIGEAPKRCLDFGSFYVFDTAEKGELTGTDFPSVNKENGKVFLYGITSNQTAYLNSKVIPLN